MALKTGRLFAGRPIAGSGLVHERHNPQLRALDNVKTAIGKTPERKAPRRVAPRRSEVWVLAQELEGTLKFDYEREPQFSALLFGVENCDIGELTLRLWRDRDDRFSAARARARASAAGTR